MRRNVVIAYFGEGASNTGDVHEAMNFAGTHRLPVVFICENNGYTISVPMSSESAVDDVADRAHSYGFGGVIVWSRRVLVHGAGDHLFEVGTDLHRARLFAAARQHRADRRRRAVANGAFCFGRTQSIKHVRALGF